MAEKTEPEEQLYDIVIPPGVPQKLIIEIPKKFKVKVVERTEKLTFANMEGDERELLAFRGRLEVVKEVEKYMLDQLRAFVRE
jgi:hypothetical protein